MRNFIDIGKTEEEQAEQVKKWIRENGMQIIAGVVLGLAAILGLDYYKNYQHENSLQARLSYLSVVSSSKNTQDLTSLQNKHADSGYTHQAELMMAKHAVDAQNYQQALDYLSPLMNSDYVFIAHTAELRSASIHLEMGNHDQALSVLSSNINSVFSSLYDHTKGDIYLALNNIDSAKKYYQLALNKLSTDSELKIIIQIKLNDLN